MLPSVTLDMDGDPDLRRGRWRQAILLFGVSGRKTCFLARLELCRLLSSGGLETPVRLPITRLFMLIAAPATVFGLLFSLPYRFPWKLNTCSGVIVPMCVLDPVVER